MTVLGLVGPIAPRALALSVAGSPAPATPSPAASAPGASPVDEARAARVRDVVRDGGVTSAEPGRATAAAKAVDPVAAVVEAGGRTDPAAVVDAAARLMARMGTPVAARLTAPGAPTAGEGASAEAPAAGTADEQPTYHSIVPAGDLDHDGHDDVFDASYTGAGDLVLSARRGTTSARLWSTDLTSSDYAFVFRGRDLDGDGAADLLVVTLTYDSTSTRTCQVLPACEYEWSDDFTWRITGLRGTDGSALWVQETHGHVDETYGYRDLFVEGDAHGELTVQGDIVALAVSDDVDGDGGVDVVVNRYDLRDTYAAEYDAFESGETWSTEVATSADVIRGATGDVLLNRSHPFRHGGGVLEPGGRLVGTSTTDFVWWETTWTEEPYRCERAVAVTLSCSGGRDYDGSLEIVDGDGLVTAWSRPISAGDDVWTYGLETTDFDVDGDGFDDIVELLFVYRDDTSSAHEIWISGADGAVIWDRVLQPRESFAFPLGELDGGPGSDLGRVRFTAEATIVGVVDGATGAPGREIYRYAPRSTVGDVSTYTYLEIVDDVDDDGVRDLLAESDTYDEASETVESWGALVSSADGEELLSRETPAWAYLRSAGDLDGDGTGDLVDVVYSADWYSSVARGIRTGTSAVLWTLTLSSYEDADTYEYQSLQLGFGDLRGDGGTDVAVATVHYDDSSAWSEITAVSGADGSPLWTVG